MSQGSPSWRPILNSASIGRSYSFSKMFGVTLPRRSRSRKRPGSAMSTSVALHCALWIAADLTEKHSPTIRHRLARQGLRHFDVWDDGAVEAEYGRLWGDSTLAVLATSRFFFPNAVDLHARELIRLRATMNHARQLFRELRETLTNDDAPRSVRASVTINRRRIAPPSRRIVMFTTGAA